MNSKLLYGIDTNYSHLAKPSLLTLPLEIRQRIYCYVLSSEHTKQPSQAIRPIDATHAGLIRARLALAAQAEDDLAILDTAILAANHQIYGEVTRYICKHTMVELCIPYWSCNWSWSFRESQMFKYASRITITANLSDFFKYEKWPRAEWNDPPDSSYGPDRSPPVIAPGVRLRDDVVEVHFHGEGFDVLGERSHRYVVQRLVGQIRRIRAANLLTFTWEGEEIPISRANDFGIWYEERTRQMF